MISRNQDAAVHYFFFDKADENRRTALAFYRTIISQLLAVYPSSLTGIGPIFDAARKYGMSRMTLTDGPSLLFRRLHEIPAQAFLVVDALDECEDIEDTLCELLDILQTPASCRALLVGRNIPPVRDFLAECHSLEITAAFTKPDIERDLSSALPDLPVSDPQGQNVLLSQISSGADDMFLWAHFIVLELKSAISPVDVSLTAERTPGGLTIFYEHILYDIAREARRWLGLAQDVFNRVLCSPRSLTWAELQCSLSLEPEETPNYLMAWNEGRPYKSAVFKVCSPFIEYHGETDSFRPAHLSVHQLLTTTAKHGNRTGLRVYLLPHNRCF